MPKKVDENGFEIFTGGSGRREGQKLKPYLVMQYLLKKTDENNCVTAEEVVGYLQENCGIDAERRSIYRDIREINKAYLMLEEGIDIYAAEEMLENDKTRRLIIYDTIKKGFRVNTARRQFKLKEIRLLAECVYSAKFIEKREASRLVDIVVDSVSEAQADTIRHEAYLTDRVKTNNEQVLDNLNSIDIAMSKIKSGKEHTPEKISFKYLKYTIQDINKPIERRNGERYIVSPYRLLISDGNYYLLGFDDDKQAMRTYRIDRMKDVKRIGAPREGAEAAKAIEISKYSQQCFSMFGGETTRVRVQFENELLDTMIDRFGKSGAQYAKVDEEHFEITAQVRVSDMFFSWVCGFGKRAKIVYPERIIDEFTAFLDRIKSVYKVDSDL